MRRAHDLCHVYSPVRPATEADVPERQCLSHTCTMASGPSLGLLIPARLVCMPPEIIAMETSDNGQNAQKDVQEMKDFALGLSG